MHIRNIANIYVYKIKHKNICENYVLPKWYKQKRDLGNYIQIQPKLDEYPTSDIKDLFKNLNKIRIISKLFI